jgi:putative SOS response-associated peptidase YedK
VKQPLTQWTLTKKRNEELRVGQARDDRHSDLMPRYKLLVDRRRCIIPADDFYEERKKENAGADVGASQRTGSRLDSPVCETCGANQTGSGSESFTIITTELFQGASLSCKKIRRPVRWSVLTRRHQCVRSFQEY